jgi:hypothetical protein
LSSNLNLTLNLHGRADQNTLLNTSQRFPKTDLAEAVQLQSHGLKWRLNRSDRCSGPFPVSGRDAAMAPWWLAAVVASAV